VSDATYTHRRPGASSAASSAAHWSPPIKQEPPLYRRSCFVSKAKRPTAPPHHWWKCHSPWDETGAQPRRASAATPGVAPQGCVAPKRSVVLSTAAVA